MKASIHVTWFPAISWFPTCSSCFATPWLPWGVGLRRVSEARAGECWGPGGPEVELKPPQPKHVWAMKPPTCFTKPPWFNRLNRLKMKWWSKKIPSMTRSPVFWAFWTLNPPTRTWSWSFFSSKMIPPRVSNLRRAAAFSFLRDLNVLKLFRNSI